MGLDIAVGWLAMNAGEVADDEFQALHEPFVGLNEILGKAGLPRHEEPLDVPASQWFEAQMWGYSGLHTVRRLAAYHALKKRLPTAEERDVDASTDPVLEALYQAHALHHRQAARSRPWVAKLLPIRRAVKPPFQHLLWHSDCEGFYVPQPFPNVLFDNASPQRESIGGMVGSTVQLLSECRELAALIELPVGIDPDEELVDAIEEAYADGPPWRRLGIEAYCVAQLIRGCERSIDTGAALVFT